MININLESSHLFLFFEDLTGVSRLKTHMCVFSALKLELALKISTCTNEEYVVSAILCVFMFVLWLLLRSLFFQTYGAVGEVISIFR